MFTGIIQGLGQLLSNQLEADGSKLLIDISALKQESLIGDSIAVNGTCLTLVTLDQGRGAFDVSAESLSKTCIAEWQVGDWLNLEQALTLSTPLGGHLVTGHVDGLGQLNAKEVDGDAVVMTFRVPAPLGRYIAQKGSVCVDGVSLTSNAILEDTSNGTTFSVSLVPHTLRMSSLKQLSVGDSVHIEIDLIARYLDRMQRYDAGSNFKNS